MPGYLITQGIFFYSTKCQEGSKGKKFNNEKYTILNILLAPAILFLFHWGTCYDFIQIVTPT